MITEDRKAVVLIVDDVPENINLLGELLQPRHQVRVAVGGPRALAIVKTPPRPDLILLDVIMPGMDGYEVLRRLRADPECDDIPVIFVTAMDESHNEEYGLSLGAVDYITKPFNPNIVLARVQTHIELKRARDRLSGQNQWLEAEIARRLSDNRLIQDLAIRALASLAEARDVETGQHILRTQGYVSILARQLASHPRFSEALSGPRLERIVKAAPLHDLGKVGIPDAILLKPGKLDPDEYAIMQTHSAIGANAIEKAMEQAKAGADPAALQRAPAAFAFLEVARDIARWHHERWDGSGYPQGLAGDAIPVCARLMALADVYDALTSWRIYKKPFDVEEAATIIQSERGAHFDPAVVDAFISARDRFAEVAANQSDPALTDTPAPPA